MSEKLVRLGLRVDVDTLRGTRRGVIPLLKILSRHQVRASFFFSVGPDNMGRNLWRLFRPAFLKKMWRSHAPSLYGWDILLMGTAWPGPQIGPRSREVLRATAEEGHEIGVHAWDHFTWQHHLDRIPPEHLAQEHHKAHEMIAESAGKGPLAAAAPGWRVNQHHLALRDQYHYLYASDCRGHALFRPRLGEQTFRTPQIPTTLPTFDELVGQAGITPENYNAALLSLLNSGPLYVYTLHAEVEGIAYGELFNQLLSEIKSRGFEVGPLSSLLPPNAEDLPLTPIQRGIVSGRAGWVSVQG